MKIDKRAPKFTRGWAPGHYMCTCHGCKSKFQGDKRAWSCADCAYDESRWISVSLQSAPTGTEAKVIADITERQKFGLSKYGVSVEDSPLPLRDWLEHAYKETLDKAIYLRRAIDEIDKQQ